MQPRWSLLVRLCSLVAVLIEYDKKGRARHTPHKRYFIMFVRSTPCSSYVCVILSVKTATKAATPNCVPQSIVRARHTPHKRYFIMLASEHVVLFLCLCYLVSKGAIKAATPNCVPLDFIMWERFVLCDIIEQ